MINHLTVRTRLQNVLIETLWNVNTGKLLLSAQSVNRINRNIVECKLVTLLSIFYHRSVVLIETLWNVNLILYDDRTLAISINRNIVECKS